MNKDELATLIEEELALAEGSQHGDLMKNREQALKYFMGDNKGDEKAGRSKVQSMDVANMTEAILSEMIDVFGGQSLVLFEPDSAKDEDQANLESEFVQHMLERSGGFMVTCEAIKDALLQRNGWIKVYVEEEEVKKSEPFQGLESELAQILQQAEQQGWQADISSVEELDGDVIKATIELERIDKHLRIYAVAPEFIRYSPEHDSSKLEGIRFFAEEALLTRSELKKLGFDGVDDLPATQAASDDTAAQRRRGHSSPENLNSPHKSTDLIKTFYVYMMVDFDDSGVAELTKIHYVVDADGAKRCFDKESVPFIPYATGSPFLMPHRVTGLSLFDKLKQIEDAKRFSIRQMLDNMNNMNNIRKKARKGSVNKDSLINSRPGGVIWCDNPLEDVVDEQKQSIIGDSVGALEYLDKMRTESGGAALDALDPNFQLAAKNVGDAGVERQLSMKEKLVAMMAKNLGESMIKDTYRLIHETLRLFFDQSLQAKLNGVWADTNPGEWKQREHLTIHIGMSGSQRMAKTVALEKMIEGQRGLMQFGLDGVMVTAKNVYQSMKDWAQLQNLNFVDQYLTDPESEEGVAAAKQKAEQAQQQKQQEQELQKGLVDTQNQLEALKISNDRDMKELSEQVKLAIEEMKIIGSATKEFELARMATKDESGNEKKNQETVN